jgi:glucose-6-phosphate isomerase
MSLIVSQKFLLHNAVNKSDCDYIEQARTELFTEMNGGYPVYLTEEEDKDLALIKKTAKHIKDNFSNLVIIATGASNTIPYSVASLSTSSKVNISYLDNADQISVDKLLNKLEPKDTAFLVISKSGETIEILALALLCIDWVKRNLGSIKLAKHFFIITDPLENSLRKIAQHLNLVTLDYPKSTGGRYAAFSSVGLLIAEVVGFSAEVILNHAKEAFTNQINSNSWVCEGASYMLSMSRIYSNSVFMIYGDQFSGFSQWYRQLIAESLGKKSQGLNPITAVGLIDQHSQLQLYLDGPNDKFFTFLSQDTRSKDEIKISHQLNDFGLNYLLGKSLKDIMNSQLINVQKMLYECKKNIRVIYTNNLEEEFFAEFMMGQMLEVILFAYTKNINPFNQPAVEKIKDSIKHILKKGTY